jgi:hypothetical protein
MGVALSDDVGGSMSAPTMCASCGSEIRLMRRHGGETIVVNAETVAAYVPPGPHQDAWWVRRTYPLHAPFCFSFGLEPSPRPRGSRRGAGAMIAPPTGRSW